MASEVLITISKDEVERAHLVSAWKYEVDTQSKVVQAKREGRKEGQQEGQREGRQQGRQERDREIAQNLKKLGIPVEQIVQGTGLSAGEIAAL